MLALLALPFFSAWAGAAAASVLPYYFRMDRETGGFEVGSLLWAVKKTPGRERDKYDIELLPLFGAKDEKAAEEESAEE